MEIEICFTIVFNRAVHAFSHVSRYIDKRSWRKTEDSLIAESDNNKTLLASEK
jgi:hypothetical protein